VEGHALRGLRTDAGEAALRVDEFAQKWGRHRFSLLPVIPAKAGMTAINQNGSLNPAGRFIPPATVPIFS